MKVVQESVKETPVRLHGARPFLPALLILLLSFFVIGQGLQAAAVSQSAAPNDVFLPIIIGGGNSGSGGNVYRDYNANGTRDTYEPGVPGIIVSAYTPDGYRLDYDVTDSQGNYTLALLAGEHYRLEFTGIPDYLQPGVVGNDSEATVAFVTGPSGDVNVGLNNPAQYCNENPELGVPCYILGSRGPDLPALISFHNRAGSTSLNDEFLPKDGSPYDDANNDEPGIQEHPTLAFANDLGATYGLAHQRSPDVLFTGAYMKRYSGFGPDGTGAIYRINREDLTVSTYADLNAIFGPNTAGANPHDDSHLSDPDAILNFWLHDPSFDQVGKIGLGDVEITEDEQYLYVVNLADKMLYRIPVVDQASPGFTSADIDRFAIPSPANCAANDVRPFALTVNDGVLYVGVTCTAQSTQVRSDMRAVVYTFDGSSFGGPVIDFQLDYPRQCADRVPGTPDCGTQVDNKDSDWRPWVSTFADLLTLSGTYQVTTPRRIAIWPQPLLTDLEFANGYMILGFRDRNGDLLGNGAFDPRDADGNPIGFPPQMSTPTTLYMTVAAGDILTAAPDPVRLNRWVLENNAAVGELPATGGENNLNGPGGGEYFYQENFAVSENFPRHAEITQGGLANVPGLADAITSAFNPVPIENPANHFDGGIIWLGGDDGQRSRSYRIFAGEAPSTTPHDPEDLVQGKNNGLGDLEVFCDPAPIEIGDRVWYDANGNGIQDPGEDPVPGVTVELYTPDNTTLLATAVTDTSGNYYFSSAESGPLSGAQAVYGITELQPNTSGYKVSIDMTQAVIANNNYVLTLTNADGQTDNNNKTDLRDSDGVQVDQFAEIVFDTAGAGHNNHTLDYGFIPADQVEKVAVGNRVWLDDGAGGGVAADGIVNGSEMGVGGVTVELYPSTGVSGSPLASTVTLTDGCYLFDNLQPGEYYLYIPADQFAAGNPLEGYVSSVPEGMDNDLDDDMDENGQNTPVNGGISSTVIALAVGAEPVNEPSRALCASTQPDASENMTVDFGFALPDQVELVAVGNRVWLDDGAGGGVAADGIVNGSEMGVGGVTVELYPSTGVSASGNPLASTVTLADGCYLFDNLPPGEYYLNIPADQFGAGGALEGYVSSIPEGTDNNLDDDMDENGQNTPVSGGISSTVITLTVGAEPINEPSRELCASTQPDANEDMTVDFGFYMHGQEVPGIEIIKKTNGLDANEPVPPGVPQIPVGGEVIWTYEVKNTGNVSFAKADVVVTDSQGVQPVFDMELVGNNDDFLDPLEVWQYKATGVAHFVGQPLPPNGVPVMWGVNEDVNGLFSIADYNNIPSGPVAAGYTNHGRLYHVDADGVTQLIPKDIGSFTIDTDFVSYLAYNRDLFVGTGLPELKAPVLLKFPLENVSPTGENIVTVVGSIPIPGFETGLVDDNISGMSFDPTTRDLYALYRVTDGPAPDKLLIVDKTNAALVKEVGVMENPQLGAVVEDGEALEFDDAGNLYVSDNWDDQLYQIDPETAQIIAIIDDDEKGGLTDVGLELKTEGLAWDPTADTMVAADDRHDLFYIQTLENGNNISLGTITELTDVESIDFLIPCYMNVGEVTAMVEINGVVVAVTDSDVSHYCN